MLPSSRLSSPVRSIASGGEGGRTAEATEKGEGERRRTTTKWPSHRVAGVRRLSSWVVISVSDSGKDSGLSCIRHTPSDKVAP